jgi:hypothetical protein
MERRRLVHSAIVAFGADAVLGYQVLGEEAVLHGLPAKDGQATRIAHRRA